jgi:MFS family permease
LTIDLSRSANTGRSKRPSNPQPLGPGRPAVIESSRDEFGFAGLGNGLVLTAPTILFSAFLLFLLQPLIASYILPWFGGSSAVWTTCMLFFQLALVAGYGYAHLSVSLLSTRAQAGLHVALLVLAVAMMPIIPTDSWKPTSVDDPSWRILALLAANVGLPFVLLASSSPLLQAWSYRLRRDVEPERIYRLYALGNAGSLLALLLYPFLMEPLLGRASRSMTWSASFAAFALLSAACAVFVWTRGSLEIVDPPRPKSKKSKKRRAKRNARYSTPYATRVLWLLLPATASLLLLAVTHQISQDVAAIPFLWVIPLAIYLISFMLVFDSDRWYRRAIFLPALIPAMGGGLALLALSGSTPIVAQVLGWAAVLMVCCMVCHGEVARSKPPAERLTGFYLTISIGGALGGLTAGLVAPLVFDLYLELHLGMWLTCVLGLIAFARDVKSPSWTRRASWVWATIVLAGLVLTLGLGADIDRSRRQAISIGRSFHGVLRVDHFAKGTSMEAVALTHGRTAHGLQFMAPNRRRWPTLYYGWSSGAGLVFRHHQPERPRRIGVVGMGAGTLSVFARASDTRRYYEIDPAVSKIALANFTFVSDSPAETEIIIGDARTSLEREESNAFDMLFLDAFSSDSIPVHLLTREAFDLFAHHLSNDGVIVANISSAHLDLEPLLRGLADHLGMQARSVHSAADGAWGVSSAHWMILSNNDALFEHKEIAAASSISDTPRRVLWTDDHANVLGAFRHF